MLCHCAPSEARQRFWGAFGQGHLAENLEGMSPFFQTLKGLINFGEISEHFHKAIHNSMDLSCQLRSPGAK